MAREYLCMNIRRVFAKPPWRRFEDLDAFSDEQAKPFYRSAVWKKRKRYCALYITLSLVGGLLLIWMSFLVLLQVVPRMLRVPMVRSHPIVADIVATVWFVLWWPVLLIGALLLELFLVGRTIRAQLRSGRCYRCAYDLSGIDVVANRDAAPSLTCPECGTDNVRIKMSRPTDS